VQQLTRRLRDVKIRYPCTEIALVDQFDDPAAGIGMVSTSGTYWLDDFKPRIKSHLLFVAIISSRFFPH
jgi:hypothetical protein